MLDSSEQVSSAAISAAMMNAGRRAVTTIGRFLSRGSVLQVAEQALGRGREVERSADVATGGFHHTGAIDMAGAQPHRSSGSRRQVVELEIAAAGDQPGAPQHDDRLEGVSVESLAPCPLEDGADVQADERRRTDQLAASLHGPAQRLDAVAPQ